MRRRRIIAVGIIATTALGFLATAGTAWGPLPCGMSSLPTFRSNQNGALAITRSWIDTDSEFYYLEIRTIYRLTVLIS
jgi:hypothetical protein